MYVYMISNIPINISLNLHFQTNPSYLNRIWLKISCILYIYMVGGFNHLEKKKSQWEGLSLFYYGK